MSIPDAEIKHESELSVRTSIPDAEIMGLSHPGARAHSLCESMRGGLAAAGAGSAAQAGERSALVDERNPDDETAWKRLTRRAEPR